MQNLVDVKYQVNLIPLNSGAIDLEMEAVLRSDFHSS